MVLARKIFIPELKKTKRTTTGLKLYRAWSRFFIFEANKLSNFAQQYLIFQASISYFSRGERLSFTLQ